MLAAVAATEATFGSRPGATEDKGKETGAKLVDTELDTTVDDTDIFGTVLLTSVETAAAVTETWEAAM